MIGTRIKSLRKKLNMTQKQLANKIRVDCSTVTKWETGKSNPDFEKQALLADIFNVSIDYLLGRTNETQPTQNEQAAEENIIRIAGRDGTFIEKKLTDEQIELMKGMLKQFPDVVDISTTHIPTTQKYITGTAAAFGGGGIVKSHTEDEDKKATDLI